ncbi:hypothetical protein [Oerskovia flava]|uniref:hypothetical protein n=1 Tax=Oerskovia flava TaxID=2986422 RepID=UPI00223EFEDC|nr:hypothetical protein [Oerskovia sp. JB1-3-2]
MTEFIEFDALLKVVVAGLIVGAGLPALFAVGVRMLSPTGGEPPVSELTASGTAVSGGAAEGGTTLTTTAPFRPAPARIAVAVLCFGTVLAGVVVGIYFLASGGH